MNKTLLAIDASNGFVSVGVFECGRLLNKSVIEVKRDVSNLIFEALDKVLSHEKKNLMKLQK